MCVSIETNHFFMQMDGAHQDNSTVECNPLNMGSDIHSCNDSDFNWLYIKAEQ